MKASRLLRCALAGVTASTAAALLTAPSATRAQIPPDVLVVGQIAEPKSIDPHVVTAVNDFRILVNLYDGRPELRRSRAGRAAPLVPDPERQGGPLQRQEDAPGGQLRDQQAGDRRERAPGHGHGATGPTPAAFAWAYNDSLEPYPYDPDKARALIEEAGHGDGAEMVFHVTEGGSGMLDPIAMGTAIQADLAGSASTPRSRPTNGTPFSAS